MEKLYHLKEEKTVYQIQKCSFSDKKFVTDYYGQHILIDVNNEIYKILNRVNLFKNQSLAKCCYVDDSVIVCPKEYDLKKYIPDVKKIEDNNGFVTIRNINVFPQVKCARTVEMSVVMRNIDCVNRSKDRTSLLLQNIKDLLKLYTFLPNSVIFLTNLEVIQKSDIFAFIIHQIDTGGAEEINGVFKTNAATRIKISGIYSHEKFEALKKSQVISRRLSGLKSVYKKIQAVILLSHEKSNHKILSGKQVLLSGPPGCGKTTLVRQIAQETGSILLEILGPEVVCPIPGDTEKEMRKFFEKAKQHAENNESCIILIDEIDSLVHGSHDNLNSHAKRITFELFRLLENVSYLSNVAVIATTNKPEFIDSKIFRPGRLADEILITIPSERERTEILTDLFKVYSIPCFENVINNISKWTNGYVGADFSLLLQETTLEIFKKKMDITPIQESQLEVIFKAAVTRMNPTSFRSTVGVITKTPTKLSDIGGLTNIKQTIYVSIILPLLQPQAFERLGIPQLKGILLYGPPGCGKTTLVQALANEVNMTFLAVSAAELYSPYVGDTEKKISQLFHQARICSPTILFIDEIDAIIGARGSSREQKVQDRVLSTLLVEMDGVGTCLDGSSYDIKVNSEDTNEELEIGSTESSRIIVIAATNRPDNVDDALKRPGRFDKLLYIPPPNNNDRLDILKKHTCRMPLSECVSLEEIAHKTELFSGADLRNLCMESALLALSQDGMNINTVSNKHFQHILMNYKPSLTKKQINFYSDFSR